MGLEVAAPPAPAAAEGGVEEEEEGVGLLGVTRSQEGHMVKVVAGNCMKNGFEVEAFKALSSWSSFWSLLFSSDNVSQHLFRYSQSTSVCFNLVLHVHVTHKTNQFSIYIYILLITTKPIKMYIYVCICQSSFVKLVYVNQIKILTRFSLILHYN